MSATPSYAQCGEDVILLFLIRHLLHLEDVYYLDIGANEPEHLNNTTLLYENGYRGVSIDANPYFESLHKASRPEDTFVVCGVGNKNMSAKFYELDPHTLSTFSKKEADDYTQSGRHKLVSVKKTKIYTIDKILKK